MKLLFDQNLSHRLVETLAALYPGSSHVRHFGLESADDEAVWQFARQQGFTIVSKDSEFHQRSFLSGFPPKVIWVRLGNCSTRDVEVVLRSHHETVRHFRDDDRHAFLVIP